MKRWAFFLAAALLTLAVAAGSAGAETRVFRIVPETSQTIFPSAEVPNAPGAAALPPSMLFRRESQGLPFSTLSALWSQAGAAYGIPWEVLAINKIESNFGRNMGPSSAGAIGWMQFMPSTWERWESTPPATADPWNAEDAIYSAARYLAAAGGRDDLYRGVYAYNHAHWYVKDVLDLARTYGSGSEIAHSLDRVQVGVEQARNKVAAANRTLVAAAPPALACSAGLRRTGSSRRGAAALHEACARQERLRSRLAALRSGAAGQGAPQAPQQGRKGLERCPGERVFQLVRPRRGQPRLGADLQRRPRVPGRRVGPSTSRSATAITTIQPPTSRLPPALRSYALALGVVDRAWHMPAGNCGIGFTLRTGDGRSWTYCHLSYLEPKRPARCAAPRGGPGWPRRVNGSFDRPASPSPASAGGFLSAGRDVVPGLRRSSLHLARRADADPHHGSRVHRRRS